MRIENTLKYFCANKYIFTYPRADCSLYAFPKGRFVKKSHILRYPELVVLFLFICQTRICLYLCTLHRLGSNTKRGRIFIVYEKKAESTQDRVSSLTHYQYHEYIHGSVFVRHLLYDYSDGKSVKRLCKREHPVFY